MGILQRPPIKTTPAAQFKLPKATKINKCESRLLVGRRPRTPLERRSLNDRQSGLAKRSLRAILKRCRNQNQTDINPAEAVARTQPCVRKSSVSEG